METQINNGIVYGFQHIETGKLLVSSKNDVVCFSDNEEAYAFSDIVTEEYYVPELNGMPFSEFYEVIEINLDNTTINDFFLNGESFNCEGINSWLAS